MKSFSDPLFPLSGGVIIPKETSHIKIFHHRRWRLRLTLYWFFATILSSRMELSCNPSVTAIINAILVYCLSVVFIFDSHYCHLSCPRLFDFCFRVFGILLHIISWSSLPHYQFNLLVGVLLYYIFFHLFELKNKQHRVEKRQTLVSAMVLDE